eukprot:360939-Chlamydomonas_euryale.AAC.1
MSTWQRQTTTACASRQSPSCRGPSRQRLGWHGSAPSACRGSAQEGWASGPRHRADAQTAAAAMFATFNITHVGHRCSGSPKLICAIGVRRMRRERAARRLQHLPRMPLMNWMLRHNPPNQKQIAFSLCPAARTKTYTCAPFSPVCCEAHLCLHCRHLACRAARVRQCRIKRHLVAALHKLGRRCHRAGLGARQQPRTTRLKSVEERHVAGKRGRKRCGRSRGGESERCGWSGGGGRVTSHGWGERGVAGRCCCVCVRCVCNVTGK